MLQSVLHAPAVRALVIQCVSFLLTVLAIRGIWMLTDMPVTLVVAVLLQGTTAAALSYWRRLPPWWLPIQFLFPGALMAMLSLSLPPEIFPRPIHFSSWLVLDYIPHPGSILSIRASGLGSGR